MAFSIKEGDQKNGVARGVKGNANAPVLYIALELSNTIWKVVFGDRARRRQVAVPAGELMKLQQGRRGEAALWAWQCDPGVELLRGGTRPSLPIYVRHLPSLKLE